ncbi:MAG: type II toxin-antitoxin system VapC family toxin [Candidatus Aenigmarchaeota archaeon]|nr:type II toxin-antitoxin system VapC family toxin [Candidatus Aenigmarchaeota archaeon]
MIGLDTWFFFQLKEKNTKAAEFWKNVTAGNNKVMVSVMVLYELGINMLATGDNRFYEEIKKMLTGMGVVLVDTDLRVVEEAMKIKYSYGLPTLDSLIVACYKVNGCKEIITGDSDIINLSKKGVIKLKILK